MTNPDTIIAYALFLLAVLVGMGFFILIVNRTTTPVSRRIRVLLKTGDVLIEKTGKITEEGLEVDGKVYPLSKEALFYVKRGPKTIAYAMVDASTNAVYVIRDNKLMKEAPPELLHKLALKRIMKLLTKREVQVLPFFTGLLIGVLILTAGMLAFYNYKIIPAEQKEAIANSRMAEYEKLKSDYNSLKTQYDQLQYQYSQLEQRYLNITQQLDNCLTTTNNTSITNSTIGG